MPRKLSNYRDSNPINYTLRSDSNAANLVLAMPFNKEYGLRDISHLIRGSGSEYTGFSYVRYSESNIIGHESCFYDSCLRAPYTPYQNSLKIDAFNIPGNLIDLGTSDFTVECWMKFDSFDFSNQFDIMYPTFIDNQNAANDVPYIVITGDSWPVAAERRGVQVRYGTGLNTSTEIVKTTSQIFSPKLWYHIAVSRVGNTFHIAVGSKESSGTGVAVDGLTTSDTIGARGTILNSATNTKDFTGYNYNFFARNFDKGRMPVGVYIQDFRYYIGVGKYSTTYRVPDPMLVY
jgi:hypothetical protein